eukprot:SAG31_NODE_988_length_10542_cov_52.848319_9_plen_70_part_00
MMEGAKCRCERVDAMTSDVEVILRYIYYNKTSVSRRGRGVAPAWSRSASRILDQVIVKIFTTLANIIYV